MSNAIDTLEPAPQKLDPTPWLAPYRFSAENARENALRAAKARAARVLERKRLHTAQPETAADLRLDLVARVQEQLNRLDRLARRETDGRKLDSLLAAQGRLITQLAQLQPTSQAPATPKPSSGRTASDTL